MSQFESDAYVPAACISTGRIVMVVILKAIGETTACHSMFPAPHAILIVICCSESVVLVNAVGISHGAPV
jgi:hypothetical protein